MFNVGLSELLVFAVVVMIILGPERLPEGIKMVLSSYQKIKSVIENAQTGIEKQLEIITLRTQLTEEMQKIKEIEKKLHEQFKYFEQVNSFNIHQEKQSNRSKKYEPLTLAIYKPDFDVRILSQNSIIKKVA